MLDFALFLVGILSFVACHSMAGMCLSIWCRSTYVVDRYFQRKRFQLGSIVLALVHLQVANWSSLVSLNKLMSEIGFELHSSGLHQCLINALDMSKAGIDRRSAAVVVRCFPVVVDRFRRVVVDRFGRDVVHRSRPF